MHFDISIKGEVKEKGLAFRVLKTADELNISGTVSYKTQNTVFIEAEGNETQIEHFLDWCTSLKLDPSIKEVIYNENILKEYNQFEMNI